MSFIFNIIYIKSGILGEKQQIVIDKNIQIPYNLCCMVSYESEAIL